MTTTPSTDELQQHALHAYRGIELGLGEADPVAAVSAKLEAQHPGHLILVQAGTFLHGFDRTAYALAILKKYSLKLIGASDEPHLRVGFPAGNFKRRLWSMVADFGIPYVVALGNQASGYTVYVSSQPSCNINTLASVSDDLIRNTIDDLRQRGELNKAAAKQLLTSPDTACFQFKAQVLELDTLILQDILKMPRDVRSTYGESLRVCMARIARAAMAYGMEDNKPALLRSLSADIDLLKHYITQAQRLSLCKLPFEPRAASAVELGRLAGGLIKSQQVQS